MTSKSKTFSSRGFHRASVSWREAFERFQVLMSAFRKLNIILTNGLTKEYSIASYLLAKEMYRISRKSGLLFLALYIKQSRVALQRFAAQDSKPVLTVYVSLTRCGIPRIIPSFHRVKIRRGDPSIIRLYMSLFSVSKLIALAPRVTEDLFKSIVTPADLGAVSRFASRMRDSLRELLVRYIPGIQSIPLHQGLDFMPTWKSLPSSAWYAKLLAGSGDSQGRPLKPFSKFTSCFIVLPYELAAFSLLSQFVHGRGEQFSQGCLWPKYTLYPFDSVGNKTIPNWSLTWYETRIGPYLPTCEQMGVPPLTGRLCQTCSGDGKRRVFAVGNYINQRLLAPLHQWLASVLKRIPMDGTFNQTKPLDRLTGSMGEISSVDLKSATDRWPLLLLFELIQALFGRSFASSAVNSTLAANIFDVSFVRKRTALSFIAGQPLGYLASWPLFALSHHVLLWWAAEQVYPGRVFTKYAILGDDIVIADSNVRDVYIGFLNSIGVGISHAKSLTSPSGACEFAKKFRLNRLQTDVSPVSVKKVLEALSPFGWYNLVLSEARELTLFNQLRLGGLGFRAASRPFGSRRLGRKAKRMMIMRLSALQPSISMRCKLGLAMGKALDPSVWGLAVWHLLEYFAPKDPILPPPEVFAYPGMMDFCEYSLYQGWMRSYLAYLKWYALVFSSPTVDLDDFLSPPVYVRTWFRPSTDFDQFKFGVMFRMYDFVVDASRRPPRCLPPGRELDHLEGVVYLSLPDNNGLLMLPTTGRQCISVSNLGGACKST